MDGTWGTPIADGKPQTFYHPMPQYWLTLKFKGAKVIQIDRIGTDQMKSSIKIFYMSNFIIF